jgi:hypothetical protein
MRTSWIREIRTPEINAWNQRVTGKNQRKITRPTIATAIHTTIIASIII